MRRPRHLIFALALVTIAGGCATTGGSGGSSSGGDVIAFEELRQYETQYTNALTLVDRRRSRWLRGRRTRLSGPGGDDNTCNSQTPTRACRQAIRNQVSSPAVYLNGARYGPLESLETTAVDRLEYMSPTDATTLFGTGVDGGVILVTLR